MKKTVNVHADMKTGMKISDRSLGFFQRSYRAKVLGLSMTLVVLTAGIVALKVSGSGFFVASEAESGTKTGNLTLISDSGTSGGKAIQFNAPATTTPTTPPTTTPPPPSTGNYTLKEWPAAYNTGYPHGLNGDTRTPVVLTAYTGPMTITTDGTVIDSKDIVGTLVIKAKNVVIKNSRIRVNMGTNTNANAIQSYDDNANLMVMDTELDGQGSDTSGGGTPLVSRTGYTLLRVNVHGSGDLTRIDGRGTIQDSWLHDPQGESSLGNADGQHHDVIQSTNATYIRILHNTMHNAYDQTSNILLKADIGPISDVIVDSNLMNGGGYTFYWYDAKFPITNGKVTNNRFMRAPTGGVWPKGGYFGTHAINAAQDPIWTNNVWDDNGAAIGL